MYPIVNDNEDDVVPVTLTIVLDVAKVVAVAAMFALDGRILSQSDASDDEPLTLASDSRTRNPLDVTEADAVIDPSETRTRNAEEATVADALIDESPSRTRLIAIDVLDDAVMLAETDCILSAVLTTADEVLTVEMTSVIVPSRPKTLTP